MTSISFCHKKKKKRKDIQSKDRISIRISKISIPHRPFINAFPHPSQWLNTVSKHLYHPIRFRRYFYSTVTAKPINPRCGNAPSSCSHIFPSSLLPYIASLFFSPKQSIQTTPTTTTTTTFNPPILRGNGGRGKKMIRQSHVEASRLGLRLRFVNRVTGLRNGGFAPMELQGEYSRNFRTVKLIKPLLACFRARCGNRVSLDDEDDDDDDVINTAMCHISVRVHWMRDFTTMEDPSSVTTGDRNYPWDCPACLRQFDSYLEAWNLRVRSGTLDSWLEVGRGRVA